MFLLFFLVQPNIQGCNVLCNCWQISNIQLDPPPSGKKDCDCFLCKWVLKILTIQRDNKTWKIVSFCLLDDKTSPLFSKLQNQPQCEKEINRVHGNIEKKLGIFFMRWENTNHKFPLWCKCKNTKNQASSHTIISRSKIKNQDSKRNRAHKEDTQFCSHQFPIMPHTNFWDLQFSCTKQFLQFCSNVPLNNFDLWFYSISGPSHTSISFPHTNNNFGQPLILLHWQTSEL
jgi:hypothetical protein